VGVGVGGGVGEGGGGRGRYTPHTPGNALGSKWNAEVVVVEQRPPSGLMSQDGRPLPPEHPDVCELSGELPRWL